MAAIGMAPNDGFLREGAGLRVIFASDEDDQSPDTVSSYLTWAEGFVVNPAHLQLNGFTGEIGGCSGPLGTAYSSSRYIEGIVATGGQSFAICDPGWSVPMADLGAAADHLADTFVLSQTPITGTFLPVRWHLAVGILASTKGGSMKLNRLLALLVVLFVGCPSGDDDDVQGDDDVQDDDVGDDDTVPTDDDDTTPGDDDDDSGDDDSAGDDDVDDHLSSSQDWVQVSAGSEHVCGLHQDGLVECWGLSDLGLTSPSPIVFDSISSNCGVTPTREIRCWGDEAPTPPEGDYIQVDSEPGYCAIDEEGWVHCWGDDEDMGEPPEGEFVQIDDGCGTAVGGTIHCWLGTSDVLEPPQGLFTHVAGARVWACGIRLDGTGVCWGSWHGLDGEPLSGGPFSQVDVGAGGVCWLRSDATVQCRGTSDDGNMDSPGGASFAQISVGAHFGCGVRTDGRIQCWGDDHGNEYGQMNPP